MFPASCAGLSIGTVGPIFAFPRRAAGAKAGVRESNPRWPPILPAPAPQRKAGGKDFATSLPRGEIDATISAIMTPRQQRFAEEYLVDLNATKAAVRAGYSKKTAGSQGERLLKNVEIQAAIQTGQAKRSEKTSVTAEQVVMELARLAFGDVRRLFDDSGQLRAIKDLDDATAAAVSSVEVSDNALGMRVTKIRLWDKKGSLELLGRHLSLFDDRIRITTDAAPDLSRLSDKELASLDRLAAKAAQPADDPSGKKPA